MNHRSSLVTALMLACLLQWPAGHAATIDIVFTREEIAVIADFYRDQSPGKKGRGNAGRGLPPGIAKNLERGKRMPPGIAKQYLPAELEGRLPPPPEGHERIVVAGKILLLEVATQIVRDVLADVLLD